VGTIINQTVQNHFLKCRNTYVSEWGRSEASGKGKKISVG